MLISGEPLLSPKVVINSQFRKVDTKTTGVGYYNYAREALREFVNSKIQNIATIYVPSYICHEAVDSLICTQVNIRYYPVKPDLTPDWDWLNNEVQSPNGILLLVHYFGFVNDLNKAISFSKEHGLLLIEDCAHSFLTTVNGFAIGSFGDAAIYSYRKIIPLPTGAGLRSKDPAYLSHKSQKSIDLKAYIGIAKQVVKYSLYKSRVPKFLWSAPTQYMNQLVESPRVQHQDRSAIPNICMKLMCQLEPTFDNIIRIRRTNYNFLATHFSKLPGISLPFPNLEPGTCPYLFPILIEKPSKVIEELNANYIPARSWPVLPQEIFANPELSVATEIASKIITFPIHQDITTNQLSYIINTFTKVYSRWPQ